jgi:hypothetical protein
MTSARQNGKDPYSQRKTLAETAVKIRNISVRFGFGLIVLTHPEGDFSFITVHDRDTLGRNFNGGNGGLGRLTSRITRPSRGRRAQRGAGV